MEKVAQEKSLFMLSEELVKKGNISEAMEALKRSLRKEEAHASDAIALAGRLYNSGDIEHSRLFLENIIEYHKSPKAFLMLASIYTQYTQKEDNKTALKYYDSYFNVVKEPTLGVCINAARVALKVADSEKTRKYYAMAVEVDGKNKEALLYLSEDSFKNKAFSTAFAYYARILKTDFKDSTHYQKAALCLYNIGDYERSARLMEKAIEESPVDDAYKARIKALREKDISEIYPDLPAREDALIEKVKESEDSSSLYDLGTICVIKGEYEKAANFYERAKSLLE